MDYKVMYEKALKDIYESPNCRICAYRDDDYTGYPCCYCRVGERKTKFKWRGEPSNENN